MPGQEPQNTHSDAGGAEHTESGLSCILSHGMLLELAV